MKMLYSEKVTEFEQQFLAPAQKFSQFDRDDIDVFVQCFRRYDLDGSGNIDVNELEFAFKEGGVGYSKAEIEELLKKVDKNNNGTIEWSEYLELMTLVHPQREAPVQKETVKESKQEQVEPKKEETPAPKAAPTSSQAPAATEQKEPVAFKAAKVTRDTSASKGPILGSTRGNKCANCGKTVYPIESLSAADLIWHKGCFRCQEDKCTVQLNLANFKAVGGKVYCQKHVPMPKLTQTTADGSLVMATALAAPKTQKASGVQKTNRMTFGPGELPTMSPSRERKE